MKIKCSVSLIFLLIIISVILLFSCTGNQAEELFETAQFEELQSNRDHALQLYRDILSKYPDSDYAQKAAERLSALEN